MNTYVNNECQINGSISGGTIQGTVHANSVIGNVIIEGITVTHSDLPDYEGDYTITPSTEEKVLATNNKSLRNDINIEAIPYYEVSNEFGKTVYIGG